MINRIVKVALIALLIILPVYFSVSLYYLDKKYFSCPIDYDWDMRIRCDSRGNGNFAAKRNGNRMHNGVDLLADMGASVYASRNGKARVADQKNGMGIYVVLYHENNVNTTYGHLLKAEIKNGDFVRQGQLIGRVGKTGNANHPSMQAHLHFEIRKDGLPQNPMEYLE